MSELVNHQRHAHDTAAQRVAYLAAEDLKLAASLLYQAYHDDALFMQLFGAHEQSVETYEKRLRATIREDLNAFWQAGQAMIGVFAGEQLLGVACVTQPGESFGPGRYWHWRLKMLLTAGYVSTKQLVDKEAQIQAAIPHQSYHMLTFIAVHPQHQHQGLGDLLVQAVNTLMLESETSAGVGVYITRDFYKSLFGRHGFTELAQLEVAKVPGAIWFCDRQHAEQDLS